MLRHRAIAHIRQNKTEQQSTGWAQLPEISSRTLVNVTTALCWGCCCHTHFDVKETEASWWGATVLQLHLVSERTDRDCRVSTPSGTLLCQQHCPSCLASQVEHCLAHPVKPKGGHAQEQLSSQHMEKDVVMGLSIQYQTVEAAHILSKTLKIRSLNVGQGQKVTSLEKTFSCMFCLTTNSQIIASQNGFPGKLPSKLIQKMV